MKETDIWISDYMAETFPISFIFPFNFTCVITDIVNISRESLSAWHQLKENLCNQSYMLNAYIHSFLVRKT